MYIRGIKLKQIINKTYAVVLESEGSVKGQRGGKDNVFEGVSYMWK